MAPLHSVESVAYLDLKISEHRHRLQEVFPHFRLTPKHHFLEHYPALIEAFGPIVGLWTMRFEAKHKFFKRVVRFSSNFKNVLLSLSTKHQLMMAYNWQRNMAKPALVISKVSSLPLEVLHIDIQESVKKLFPQLTSVQLSNTDIPWNKVFSWDDLDVRFYRRAPRFCRDHTDVDLGQPSLLHC